MRNLAMILVASVAVVVALGEANAGNYDHCKRGGPYSDVYDAKCIQDTKDAEYRQSQRSKLIKPLNVQTSQPIRGVVDVKKLTQPARPKIRLPQS